MKYNLLKKTGWKISALSFGCMSLKAGGKDNDAIIGRAIDSGINLFDTADLYENGGNERLLGHALKGRRQQVHVSTKVGNRWRADGSGWDWCPRRDYILSAVDESLRRLQTDYIDLYLLHGGTAEDPIDEAIEAFERLKEQGKILHYGISSIRPNVIREYVQRSAIAAVMTQYSYLDRRPEEQVLDLLLQHDIGVLARGTVAGGLLIDKPAAPYLGMAAGEVDQLIKTFRDNSNPEHDAYPAAFQYVAAHPAITTAVAGIRTQSQLEEALAAARKSPLLPGELMRLRGASEANTYKEHR